MIFAIALSSNFKRQFYFDFIYQQLKSLGQVQFSSVYLIPCRDGIGEDYWNAACLLSCEYDVLHMENLAKQWEIQAHRIRPSHEISLDIDIIAYGEQLSDMQFICKKLPLPIDVKIPLGELWQHSELMGEYPQFPVVDFQH